MKNLKHIITALLILMSFGAFAQTTTVHLKGTIKAVAKDAHIVSMKWTKISGPSAGNFVTPANIETDVTGCVIGTYYFEFSATDNFGMTGRDTTQVDIDRDGVPPVVDAGPDQKLLLKIILGAVGAAIIGFFVFRKKK